MSSIFVDSGKPEKADSTKRKTWSQYQELRRKNPRLYYSSKTQQQVANDLTALGRDKFFD